MPKFFPFISYRSEKERTDLALLKGLVRYRKRKDESSLNVLWLPFGLEWGRPVVLNERRAETDLRSGL